MATCVSMHVERVGRGHCKVVEEAEALAAGGVVLRCDSAQRPRVVPGRAHSAKDVPGLQ